MSKARKCVTHHYACDCREARFKELETKLAIAKDALETISEDKCHNEHDTEESTGGYSLITCPFKGCIAYAALKKLTAEEEK